MDNLLKTLAHFTQIPVDELREVQLSSDVYNFGRTKFRQKMCFYNAGIAMAFASGEAHYVLGYMISELIPIPIEHAWVKIDGEYYDPTAQFLSNDDIRYFPLYELDCAEFLGMTGQNDSYPPTLFEVGFYRSKQKEKERG